MFSLLILNIKNYLCFFFFYNYFLCISHILGECKTSHLVLSGIYIIHRQHHVRYVHHRKILIWCHDFNLSKFWALSSSIKSLYFKIQTIPNRNIKSIHEKTMYNYKTKQQHRTWTGRVSLAPVLSFKIHKHPIINFFLKWIIIINQKQNKQ